MHKSVKVLVLMAFISVSLFACGQQAAVIDSGVYEGEIAQVKPEEEEIYVNLDEGTQIELYFTEETTLTKGDEEVEFSQLEAGQRVSVEVEREGNSLDPVSVKILE